MKRSAIIALAKELILQGSGDPAWGYREWDTLFCEAVDIMHEALTAADLDLFVTRDATISLTGDVFPLPSDLHSVKWVSDADGPVRAVDHYSEKESYGVGYTLQDENLILVNWDGPVPTTLTIDYVREPKEISAWAGSDDPDTDEYEPDFPLNTSRGARTLARVMSVMAKIKDGSNDQAGMDQANTAANRFVDRLLSRRQFE